MVHRINEEHNINKVQSSPENQYLYVDFVTSYLRVRSAHLTYRIETFAVVAYAFAGLGVADSMFAVDTIVAVDTVSATIALSTWNPLPETQTWTKIIKIHILHTGNELIKTQLLPFCNDTKDARFAWTHL